MSDVIGIIDFAVFYSPGGGVSLLRACDQCLGFPVVDSVALRLKVEVKVPLG